MAARSRRAAARSQSVAFRNVPSFVVARGVPAGGVEVDVAYGGAIYAFAAGASARDCASRPEHLPRLIAARPRGQARTLDGQPESARHRGDDRLSGIYGTVLYEEVGPLHQRNVTIFADGEVDRSPHRLGHIGPHGIVAGRRSAEKGRDLAPRLDRRHHVPRLARSASRRAASSPRSRERRSTPASTAFSSTPAILWEPDSFCDERPRVGHNVTAVTVQGEPQVQVQDRPPGSGLRRAFLDERHGPLPALLLALTMLAGVLDATTILRLGHVFVATMTGNLVFMGLAAAGAQGFSVGVSALALWASSLAC